MLNGLDNHLNPTVVPRTVKSIRTPPLDQRQPNGQPNPRSSAPRYHTSFHALLSPCEHSAHRHVICPHLFLCRRPTREQRKALLLLASAFDEMEEEMASSVSNNVVDIYPLSGYHFGSKEAAPEKDETLSDRIERMKSKYNFCFWCLICSISSFFFPFFSRSDSVLFFFSFM